MDGIFVGGGGDYFEVVDLGFKWVVENNWFCLCVRKVLFVFGDVLLYVENCVVCLMMVVDFRNW